MKIREGFVSNSSSSSFILKRVNVERFEEDDDYAMDLLFKAELPRSLKEVLLEKIRDSIELDDDPYSLSYDDDDEPKHKKGNTLSCSLNDYAYHDPIEQLLSQHPEDYLRTNIEISRD